MWRRAGRRPLRSRSPGTTRSRSSRDALRALGVARRGRLLHLGPHQQRGGVPVPALRAPARHQQPARLLEHVPRVERRRAHASRSASARARSALEDFDARRRDLRHRPEPRHQPPAHADRAAGRASAAAARSSASTRCASAGWCASRIRRSRSACSAAAPPLADLLPAGAHRRRRRAAAGASRRRCSRRRSARPGSVLDHALHRRAHRRASRPIARALDAARLGRRSRRAAASSRDADARGRRRSTRGAQRVIACWAMGLTQHAHGVANVQEIVNLLLLRGQHRRAAAPGLCPVRGHSNVQGDRTVGHHREARAPAFLDALGARVRLRAAARSTASTPSARSAAMRDGRARVFFALGGNFRSATPDTALHRRGARALRADRAGLDQAQPHAPA